MRMKKFDLKIHPEKTKLIRFGRFAKAQHQELGEGKPDTFDFLGFTHYCTNTKNGKWFVVGRKTIKKRMRAQLLEIKRSFRERLHAPISETGAWLRRILTGHLNYYAVPGNGASLKCFFNHVAWCWIRTLRRRSQRQCMRWERFGSIMITWLGATSTQPTRMTMSRPCSISDPPSRVFLCATHQRNWQAAPLFASRL